MFHLVGIGSEIYIGKNVNAIHSVDSVSLGLGHLSPSPSKFLQNGERMIFELRSFFRVIGKILAVECK